MITTCDWEYKVITMKRPGFFQMNQTPNDDEITVLLNREGAQGWELVNALGYGTLHPVTLYFKRPR